LIHASLDFKQAMIDAQKYIESNSMHKVVLPELTRYQDIRDVQGDDETFTNIKNRLTKENFKNVESSDILLILNYSHRGIKNYIGGNSFMEMVVASFLNKPIYLLNDIPENMTFTEEIKALYPMVVKDLTNFLNIVK
jgi:hypothetical protein